LYEQIPQNQSKQHAMHTDSHVDLFFENPTVFLRYNNNIILLKNQKEEEIRRIHDGDGGMFYDLCDSPPLHHGECVRERKRGRELASSVVS
jgi:hypothetical protein